MRGVGVKRVTYQQQMEHIAVRTMRRVITAAGWEHVKFTQETSFSVEAAITPDRQELIEAILLEEGYLKTHAGEFVHKKMRLNDFVSIGGMVSVVPKQKQLLVDASWPYVSEEEVRAVEERLKMPHGI